MLRPLWALGFALVMVATPQLLSAQQRHGDVNSDGVVSALDAQAILTAVVQLPLPPGYIVANGDANCDSATGALDAQIVLSYVIGLNVSQYCVAQPFGPSAVRITVAPRDTSLLINRGIKLVATLHDLEGFQLDRPTVWSTSAADLVAIDSVKKDSAWVSARTTAGTATISVHSDGSLAQRLIRVFTSYAGIIITPQRGDTLRQLNGTTTFTARNRDSVGVVSGSPQARWTVADTNIATVPLGPSNSGVVTAKTMGLTFLHAQSATDPDVRDSLALVVSLPPLNTCTGQGGTLHQSQTYTTPQTWTPATNPHYVSGTLNFNTGSSLTIQPGTLVCTQSGAFLAFHAGSRMAAIGTATEPIVFRPTTPTDFWSGIQLGDFSTIQPTAPPDTSVLRNVVIEHVSNGSGALQGRERHVVTFDSVRIRQSNVEAVAVMSQGSRMLRSTIDTVLTTSTASHAVILGRGSLEESTVRVAGASSGIQLLEAATIRDVDIIGGSTAIRQICCADSARLNDVRITGTSGVALELPWGLLHPLTANVLVSGGTGGAFSGQIGNLAHLYADSISQQTLLGNGRDTLFLTGGLLTGRTLVVRPDLPWRVSAQLNIDTLGVLAPRPGATLLFENGGLQFVQGGTLNAIGEASKVITFKPTPGSSANFFGIQFSNPGAAANPANNPTAVSTLTYVRLDSASGAAFPTGGICHNSCVAAINAGDRHRVLIDNARIHKAWSGAVYLNTPGSQITNSLIDTTGTVASGYVANSAAVALGERTVLQNTTVHRSGHMGVHTEATPVADTSARLQNVRIVASRDAGLHAEQGVLAGDHGSVRIDSANAYAFLGTIQNLAALARDSVTQLQLMGNVGDVVVITGGTLRGTPGVHTPGAPLVLEAIPGLPWQLNNAASIIDTLAQLRPRPASEFRFFNASFSFQGGGTLVAVGEAAKVIRFRPLDGSSGNFHGLQFQNPGPDVNPANNPTAVSTLTYVRLDSASGAAFPTGGICHNSCVAAINAGDRHRLLIDNARIHKAWSGAIYAATPLTTITNSLIDTTGTVASGYVANSAAVALNDSVSMSNVVVHRSGHTGIHLDGDAITIVGVRVSQSRGIGIQVANNSASTGSQGLQLSGFAVDSAGGVGVSIEATDVRLSDCDVLNGMSHGLATSTSLTGVRINDCNIENNGRSGTGLGVSNFNVGPTPPNSFEIDANNNFWGSGAPPVLDAINGISLNVGVSSVRTARIIH